MPTRGGPFDVCSCTGTSAGVCFAAAHIHRSQAAYRLGRDRGSPNHESMLFSKAGHGADPVAGSADRTRAQALGGQDLPYDLEVSSDQRRASRRPLSVSGGV